MQSEGWLNPGLYPQRIHGIVYRWHGWYGWYGW